MEDVFVEHVQDGRLDHEPVEAHPQTIRKCDERKGDDEVGEERGHEDYEAFGGQQVTEEPEDPGEEGGGGGLEVDEPVGDDGEEQRKEEEVGKADEEVGDHQSGGAVQAVATFFDVLEVVLEPGGAVGDGHEGHEGGAAVGDKLSASCLGEGEGKGRRLTRTKH